MRQQFDNYEAGEGYDCDFSSYVASCSIHKNDNSSPLRSFNIKAYSETKTLTPSRLNSEGQMVDDTTRFTRVSHIEFKPGSSTGEFPDLLIYTQFQPEDCTIEK